MFLSKGRWEWEEFLSFNFSFFKRVKRRMSENYFKKVFKAPNFETILKEDLKKKRIMEGSRTYEGSQNTIPVDGKLLQKIGVSSGDKVYFFAGGGGDWAEAIGKETKLTFADLSNRIVSRVGRKRKIGERQVVINALRAPVRENEFDWSVSFEPVPLAGEALPITVLRGLLNRRGVKIIRHSMYSGESEIARVLKSVYGVENEEKIVRVECVEKPRLRNLFTGRESKTHVVTTVHTNSEARSKVLKDLKVMMLIERLKRRGEKSVSLEKLFENTSKCGLKNEEVKESLERINKFSTLLSEKHKTVLID